MLVASDLEEVFCEKVRRIAHARGLSAGSAAYLTKILVQKGRATPIPSALFDLYKKAVESEGITSAHHYKTLGDQSLFVLGVFPESLNRKAVSSSYYLEMGRIAYGSAGTILKHGVYQELAEDFRVATWTIKDVIEELRLESQDDILALYEQWLATGSLRVLKRLQELGFVFQRGLK